MRHRNDNMLLRIAQADAYAVACEYVKKKDAPNLKEEMLKFEKYHQHPTYDKLKPGMYTDDTQMSIAVAETLLYAKQYELDPDGPRSWDDDLEAETFVARFYISFARDPRDGYSRGFQKILEEAKDPYHLRQLIVPNSTKNGAAMRSVPIGVIKDIPTLVSVAGRQASTTHATYGGINSSIAVALMSHFALYDRREFSSMRRWGNKYCQIFEHFGEPWDGPVSGPCKRSPYDVGINTVHAVHTLLTEEKSLMDMMKRLLMWGGDTDSVAAIAWGIASCRYQDEVLPEFLERDLEVGGKYGVEYLKTLGKNLMDAYK